MSTIVFRVNLETVNKFANKQPYNQYDSTISDEFRETRVTWFPNILRNNNKLTHGDEFTLSGVQALYMRDNFTSGDFKFLDVVSTSTP